MVNLRMSKLPVGLLIYQFTIYYEIKGGDLWML